MFVRYSLKFNLRSDADDLIASNTDEYSFRRNNLRGEKLEDRMEMSGSFIIVKSSRRSFISLA